ncbi:DUF6602 domain-containing protein [Agromyces chromiiresistens]|uniref:DUF6602 domain-containing protein n=1 Tax=Agromyces chromiiresistens TaxID=3030835 RepID=UPI003B82C99F
MSQPVSYLLKTAEERLWADFKAAGAFDHRPTVGTSREDALIDFLRRRLPTRFGVARGEVIDIGGKRTGQVDVVIFDQHMNVPLNADTGGSVLLPAEALLAAIEVKTTLTKEESRKALVGAQKLYQLQPWGSSWGWVRRGDSAAAKPRVLATCLALDSDLTSDWSVDELLRLRRVASDQSVHVAHLHSVAVLSRGMIRPAEGLVALEPDHRGVLGMWYFALLGFLVREADRRAPVPWSYYEEAVDRKWLPLAPRITTLPPSTNRTGRAVWDYIRAGRPEPTDSAR